MTAAPSLPASAPLAASIALVVGAIACWAFVVRSAWRAWQPARLLRIGRYADARAAAQALGRSWMRVFPSVRISVPYVVGCALHLEGDLEGALETLAPLQGARLSADMRRAVDSIEAACLVLADRDPMRADTLLERASANRPPEGLLLAALAKLGTGSEEAASRLFAEANARADVHGETFHTLRGLWFTRVGRLTEAQRDFELAAKHPIPNVYVSLARAMLDATAVDAESREPSSLAPQVLPEGPRRS